MASASFCMSFCSKDIVVNLEAFKNSLEGRVFLEQYSEAKLDNDFSVFKKYKTRSTLHGKLRMLIQQEGIQEFLFYAIGRCGTMKMMRATDFSIQKCFFNQATNNGVVHFLNLKHPFIQRARFVSTEEGGFGVISQLDSFKRHGKYGEALHMYFHVYHN